MTAILCSRFKLACLASALALVGVYQLELPMRSGPFWALSLSRDKSLQNFRAAEPWYLELLAKEGERCPHTSTFFHYFLPHTQCRSPRRIGECNDGGKWICLDAFEGRTTHRAKEQSRNCVVYSFGSSDDSCFESAMADYFDCEIHIFDPTSSELRDDRWTYHNYGLGGADLNVTRYWSWKTQKQAECVHCVMKSLDQIMNELGHHTVDILKVDIDGAEWRSFKHIYNALSTLPADQLQIELTGLDITSKDDSLAGKFPGVYEFWSHLIQDGFKVFYIEANQGTCQKRDQLRAASIEYALWKPLASNLG